MVNRRSPYHPPAWFARPAARLRFQRQLAECGVPVRTTNPPRSHRGGFALTAMLRGLDVADQTLTIVFGPQSVVPTVYTDGDPRSPHRYRGGALCMWQPTDPADLRWTLRDGGAALLGHVVAHLMREEWWRSTGEWPGAEAPHLPVATTTEVT